MAHLSFEGVCCSDCVQPVANGDFSSLDYYYEQAEADQKMKLIERGMNHLCKEHGGSLHCGVRVEGIHQATCGICGALRLGRWNRIFVLAPHENSEAADLALLQELGQAYRGLLEIPAFPGRKGLVSMDRLILAQRYGARRLWRLKERGLIIVGIGQDLDVSLSKEGLASLYPAPA